MIVIVHREGCDCASCAHVRVKRRQVAEMLRAEAKSRKRWVPHISRNGARFHVLSWYGTRDALGRIHGECRCSEPRCEINRPRKRGEDDSRAF